jgi:hypothetical protein
MEKITISISNLTVGYLWIDRGTSEHQCPQQGLRLCLNSLLFGTNAERNLAFSIFTNQFQDAISALQASLADGN